jgi:hypothetical protein
MVTFKNGTLGRMDRHCARSLLLVYVLYCNNRILTISSSSATASTSTEAVFRRHAFTNKTVPKSYFERDPFVEAAPLIIAAVCQNGVALIALHHPTPDPLIFLDDEDDRHNEDDGNYFYQNNTETSNTTARHQNGFRDLPHWYAGPFRIHNLNHPSEEPIILMGSGWRADTEQWIDHGKNLVRREAALSYIPTIDRKYQLMFSASFLPRYLTKELTDFLALKTVSEGIRPYSCAGLLVTTTTSALSREQKQLWLLDATGPYRIRAHALGGGQYVDDQDTQTLDGAVRGTSAVVNSEKLADVVNARLAQVDWTQFDTEAGLFHILQMLGNLLGPTKSNSETAHTRVEIASIELVTKSRNNSSTALQHRTYAFKRHRVSDLFPLPTNQ